VIASHLLLSVIEMERQQDLRRWELRREAAARVENASGRGRHRSVPRLHLRSLIARLQPTALHRADRTAGTSACC